ncbi:hypothetical protein MKW94_001115 [Papaver nudicaule]|uniref:Uncharacterized protein n=1 Tax=Papaver nudicaule TaxID=74823 RepID=A0AA41VIB0_PAPNU|nr:hypothetical protein [Papaver nudicaule]
MNLFYIFFGWRKASSCKRLIKRVQSRIKLLKNKRDSMIIHLREDILPLLKNGQDQTAFAQVAQLSKDQNLVAAYELLDHFCEFIMINLPYIRKHRDLPNDINEAASSLLHASARCGDLPELRKLFGDRYGNRFAIAAVELLPGNLVNRQLVQNLSVKPISDDAKFRMMKEIARENCLDMDPLQIDVEEFYSAVGDWDLRDPNPNLESPCTGLQDVHKVETQEDTKFETYLADSRELVIAAKVDRTKVEASDSRELVIASKVEIPRKSDIMDESETVFQDSCTSQRNSGICSIRSEVSSSSVPPHKNKAITGVATSEGSFQISDRNIVYLDDIEEFEPSVQVDGNFKEQRLFLFKSAYVPRGKECTEKLVSSDCNTSSRSSTKKRRSSRRGLNRRYLYMENQMSQSPTSVCSSTKDVEYAFYYNNDSRHNRKKNQKSMSVGDRGSFCFNSKGIEFFSSQQWGTELRSPEELRFEEYQRRAKSSCGFNCAAECSLDHPCYFVVCADISTTKVS